MGIICSLVRSVEEKKRGFREREGIGEEKTPSDRSGLIQLGHPSHGDEPTSSPLRSLPYSSSYICHAPFEIWSLHLHSRKRDGPGDDRGCSSRGGKGAELSCFAMSGQSKLEPCEHLLDEK